MKNWHSKQYTRSVSPLKQSTGSVGEGLIEISEGFVHRDIKLENIMIQERDPISIKLIDFGFAEKIDENKLKSGQGTAGYIAPEVFKLAPYTRKSDVFSIGVILFALLSNTSPFKSDNYQGLLELNKQCKINYNKKVWSSVSKETLALKQLLLEPDPIKRISLSDLITTLRKTLKKKDILCEVKITSQPNSNQIQPSQNQFDIRLLQLEQDGGAGESKGGFESKGGVDSKGGIDSDPNQEGGDLQFQTKTFLSFYKHSNNSQFSMIDIQKKKAISGDLSTPLPRNPKQKLTSRTTKSQDVPTSKNLRHTDDQLASSDNESAINCSFLKTLKESTLIYNNKKWIGK